ncbi:hypothetical protein [Candidatus Phytoplasma solani]|uniref:hypothetical protein n=1 Tax=Candidatus Phytoplasma solani TaxID=69896 RepID=UPI00358DEB38
MPRYVELRIAFDHLNNQINLKTEKWRSLPSSTEKNELYNEIKSIENKRDDLIGELSILEGKLEQIPEHQRTIEEAETNRLGVFKYLKDEEKRIKNKEKEIKEKILSQLKSLYKII